jgi:hypothetical protein
VPYIVLASFLMTATLYLTVLALHSITVPCCRRSPPSPLYSGLVVTTCLYALSAALLTAKLGRCLHP